MAASFFFGLKYMILDFFIANCIGAIVMFVFACYILSSIRLP